MKKIILLTFWAIATVSLFAQKKITPSATIKFDASTSIDKLPVAENKTGIATLNTQTGAVVFEATVKNFTFSNPMMQDHFNGSGWLDSDKHPTFSYKGNITDLTAVNFPK